MDEGVPFRRHQEDRFQFRVQATIREGHPGFEIEITDLAQPPDDDGRTTGAREIAQQPLERNDRNVWQLSGAFFDQGTALIQRQKRLFRPVHRHRDLDPIEQPRGPLDQIQMAEGEWIERAREKGQAI